MSLADFDYALPSRLIAFHPLARRDDSRLLVIGKKVTHARIRDLPSIIPKESLVVVNDTRVLPARVFGTREPGGGRVELLCVRPLANRSWLCLGQASKPLRAGTVILFEGSRATVVGRSDEALLELRFEGDEVPTLLARAGHVPLPPYIKRPDEPADRERYQTVFAAEPGAVAAPTAGLHFTPPLLKRIARRAEVRSLTLHVGPGTFLQPRGHARKDWRVPAEMYRIPPSTIAAIRDAQQSGRTIIAVGTTTTRTLETFARTGRPEGETDLILAPGDEFQLVGGLLTNFHIPKSTLLALVCAFGGTKRVLHAYRQALRARYRMLSYGDAMLVWP